MTAASAGPADSAPRARSFFRVFWQVSFFQTFNSAAAFLLNILVTRWMGPAAFGNFYFFLSVGIATNILFDFGLSRTLLRYAPHHAARGEKGHQLAYYAAALDLKTAAGTVLLAAGVAASWVWGGELRWPLIWGLVTGFIVSYSQFVAVVAQAEEKFPLYNLALSFNTLRLIVVAALALFGALRVSTLYGACILAPLLLALIPAGIVWRDLRGHPLPDKAEFYRSLVAFGKWMIAISILETLYQRTDVILLRALTDAPTTGHYSGALAFFGLVTMLPAYTATLIYPRFVQAKSAGDAPAFARAYRVSTDLVAFTAIPLAFGLWAAAPELVHAVIGGEYRAALPLFGYLAAYSIFFSGYLNTGGVFYAQDRPQDALAIVGAGLAVNVLGNLLLVPRLGLLGAGLTVASASGLCLALAWAQIRRRFGLWPDFRHLAGYLALAGLFWFLLRRPLALPPFWALAVKAAAGGALYLGVLAALDRWAGRGWIPRGTA